MRAWVAAAMAALSLAAAPDARAGVYGDDLARCLVKSATPKDQTLLMTWIFAGMSGHPDVRKYASVTEAERESLNADGARLYERLMTVDCRTELVTALKYEGPNTIEAAFEVLGRVAMQGLMRHPAVVDWLAGLSAHFDAAKLEEIAREAGFATPGE